MLGDFSLPSGQASAGIVWSDVALSFYALVLEGAPFLLLGAIISGLMDVLLPADRVRAWLPQSKGLAIVWAIIGGVMFPLCECGTMPVVQRLVKKGVSPSVAAMYLLAAPALNPIAMISTWLAFRNQDPLEMVVLRVGFSLVVLGFIGTWLHGLKPEEIVRPELLLGPGFGRKGAKAEISSTGGMEELQAPRAGMAYGALQQFTGAVTRDFLGVLVYLIIGAGVAAFFSAGFNRSALVPIGGSVWMGPLAGIFLSQILCLCSTTDAFIIAAFAPFSVPAKVAFLVAGPLIDMKLYWLYRSAFRQEFVHALWKRALAVTFILTLLYGLKP